MSNHTHAGCPPSPRTNLTCQQTIGLLVDYLAGDMEATPLAAFVAHLCNCPECMAFLRTYLETIRVTHAMRDHTVPAGMLARMQRSLRERIKHTPPEV